MSRGRQEQVETMGRGASNVPKAGLRLATVGDIAFTGRHRALVGAGLFEAVVPVFKRADLVVGNLEGPLTLRGKAVPGKCALRGQPAWAKSLRETGIGLVSLANNHLMDWGEQGLLDTLDALDLAGIKHFGAGRNRKDACAPLLLDLKGKRLAFLGRTQVVVSSPSYASEDQAGVAFLDLAETLETIRACRKQADLVVLLVHWGLENYSYPSPAQRLLARRFAEAGADLVLGHHPHVLQGHEMVGKTLVAYSLGNFLFDEFEWEHSVPNQPPKKMFQALTPAQKEGIVLSLELDPQRTIRIEPTFTRIGEDARLSLGQQEQRRGKFSTLCTALRIPFYPLVWRGYSLWKEWELRIRPAVFPAGILGKIMRLRFRHVREVINILRRSIWVSAGRSTNPYE